MPAIGSPHSAVGSCCQTPRNLTVNVPGVNVATANVNVGSTSTSVASARASSMASASSYGSANASGGSGVFFSGGGGYYSNPGVPGSTISNFSVDGGYETKLVEEDVAGTEEVCVDKIVEELRTRPQFVRITGAGMRESHVHDVSITKEAPNYRGGR
jgi:hypothetical protein